LLDFGPYWNHEIYCHVYAIKYNISYNLRRHYKIKYRTNQIRAIRNKYNEFYRNYYNFKQKIDFKLFWHYTNQSGKNLQNISLQRKFLKNHLPYRPKYIQKYYDFLDLLEDKGMIAK
jgi:hypothetical protein